VLFRSPIATNHVKIHANKENQSDNETPTANQHSSRSFHLCRDSFLIKSFTPSNQCLASKTYLGTHINNEKSEPDDDDDEEEDHKSLKEEDIDFLLSNTGFNVEQIREWHKQFLRKCPTGFISKKQFCAYYESLMPSTLSNKSKNEVSCKLFKLFDIDQDDSLCFSEFLISFWIRCQAPVREKFTWLFNMFDTDHNDYLNYYEFRHAIECCLNLNDLDELLEMLYEDRTQFLHNYNMANGNTQQLEDIDEAFYEEHSAFTSKSNLLYGDQMLNNMLSNSMTSVSEAQKYQQYNIYSKTTKLVNDKMNELMIQLDLAANFYSKKHSVEAMQACSTSFPYAFSTRNFKVFRETFVNLCDKYENLRKMLIPITYFYKN